MSEAVVTSYNKLRRDLAHLIAGRISHVAATAVIATADATTAGTFSTLAADFHTALSAHAASVIHATDGSGAHLAAVAIPAAGNTSPRSIVQSLVAAYHDHIESTAAHFARDGANRVTFTPRDGSDAESYALMNALKAAYNGHVARAFTSDVAV